MVHVGLREKMMVFAALVAAFLTVAPTAFVYAETPAAAAASYCMCHSDLATITPDTQAQLVTKDAAFWKSGCLPVPDAFECAAIQAKGGYAECDRLYASSLDCKDAETIFDKQLTQRFSDAKQAGLGTGKFKSAFIPDCALEDDLKPECRDVSIFVILAINIANYMFSIIGALALLVFVYGGFRLILSQGNAEQVEAGKGAMVAAVTGLAVAFGGYLLIQFVSSIIGVTTPLL